MPFIVGESDRQRGSIYVDGGVQVHVHVNVNDHGADHDHVNVNVNGTSTFLGTPDPSVGELAFLLNLPQPASAEPRWWRRSRSRRWLRSMCAVRAAAERLPLVWRSRDDR